MIVLRLCYFVFLFFFLMLSPKQNGKGDVIIWNRDNKLKWEDFKGEGDTCVVHLVSTSYSFGTTFKPLKGNRLELFIACTMNKSLSPKSSLINSLDTNTQKRILEHEQTHFDIGELFTRKLRVEIYKLFPKAKHKDSDWLLDKIDKLNLQMNKECNLYQDQYDADMGNIELPGPYKGNNLDSLYNNLHCWKTQLKWIEKVQTELDKLERYNKSDTIIDVKRNTCM